MTIREIPAASELPDWAQRLEVQALVLQCVLAAAFTIVVQDAGKQAQVVAGAINVYHLLRVCYVLRFRLKGRNIPGVAAVVPVTDVLCITAAWSVAGSLSAPIWGLYLYAVVNHGQSLGPWKLAAYLVFVVFNMGFAMVAVGAGPAAVATNMNLWTMALVVVAIGLLTHAMRAAWYGAEHSARRLAHTDALTGIGNRRWVTECLDEVAAGSEPYAVLMLDLDDFKSINDEFGHDVGDTVLVRAAHLIADSLRPGDILGRFGGEEFIVVLPNAGMVEARAVAERLRQKVRAGTPTSVSVGCAVRSYEDTPADVIQRADALMLVAKRTGKNSVRSELALVA